MLPRSIRPASNPASSTASMSDFGMSYPNSTNAARLIEPWPEAAALPDSVPHPFDLAYDAFRAHTGRVFHAPIRAVTSVLDVHCGAGSWANDMAVYMPQARIIGVDPRPHRAQAHQRMPNVHFVAGDIRTGLPFPDSAFDYVHMRLQFLGMRSDVWPAAIAEVARVVRPGGWIELVEAGFPHNGHPALERMATWTAQAAAQRGVDITLGLRVGDMLRGMGLAFVETHDVAMPTGARAGEPGRRMEAAFFALLDRLREPIQAEAIATSVEFTRALTDLHAEHAARPVALPFCIAVGQRA